MILEILALALGGVGGYALAKGRELGRREDEQKALRPVGPKVPLPALPKPPLPVPTPLPQERYREPDPHATINVPVDAEDFAQLGEAFCTCLRALEADLGRLPMVAELRDCFLEAIHPDFVWPPVPGDPSGAHLLWLIADHEARKVLANPDAACPRPTQLGHGQGGGG